MDSLRQELERHASESFSLARWKLTIVAVFTITGLGWNFQLAGKLEDLAGLLILYSTGFLCAYIDSLFYRRGSATHAIAAGIRQYSGDEKDAKAEKVYEQVIEKFRVENRYFLSDYILQFIASVVFSVGPAVLGYIAYKSVASAQLSLIAIPVAALLTNIIMFVIYRMKRNYLRS